jgi:polysaccharide export outer membrane protein
VLSVVVVGEPELSQPYTVLSGGELALPYVGKVVVSGLTVDQVAGRLTDAFSAGWLKHPQVSVSVSQHRSQKVVVVGDGVKNAGTYYLTGPTRLMEVLSQAGWVADSDRRKVTLQRADGSRLEVDLGAISRGQAGDVDLWPGDQVTVEVAAVVYVGGEVQKPGAVPFREGLTALQAVNLAGGPSAVARLRGAYVLRGEVRLPLNLKRIQRGREADLALESGDQLFLAESAL